MEDVLNKLKEIFMADKVIPRAKEWPDEQTGVLPEDWQPSEELTPLDTDPEYLEYSAEAVGYQDRETQWNIYRTVTSYLLPDEDGELSIIDALLKTPDSRDFLKNINYFNTKDLDLVGY